MPGARCARSLVCEIAEHTSVVTTVTPETPGIPRAMVLTAYIALSPVTGLSCHRRPQDHHLASLTSASGYQDHTTSPSAGRRIRLVCCRVHRIPHPTSVTMRNAPPEGSGTALDIHLICASEKQKYFWRGGWTSGRKRVCETTRRANQLSGFVAS